MPHVGRRFRQPRRRTDDADLPGHRMLALDQGAARDDLRMIDDAIDGVDRADRNAPAHQDRFPLLVRLGEKHLLQRVDERLAVRDARGVGRVARIGRRARRSPISRQNVRHSLSLPTPSARSRVFVRNVWYGSSAAYAVPHGPGTMPSAR